MNKPNKIRNILLLVTALGLLAFTVSNEWSKSESFSPQTSLSKEKGDIISNLNFAPGQKINPAHGKPGHQCGIPVGAALKNDKPVTTNITPSPTDLPLKNLSNQPQLLDLAKSTAAPANPLASVSATGANPAHGQPGHRCDIAVGAPLNSTPVAKPATTTVETATPNSVPPKKNPAHGQPHHRCDIAVGAPLDSKPAAKTTLPIVNSPTIKPDTTTPVFTYDSTGARLNPAHGKPGHDCSIAVGSPLKK